MMNFKISSVVFVFMIAVVSCPAIVNAALYNDSSAVMADSVTFHGTSGPTFIGYIDYAVYAPGDYVGSVSFPEQFIYCYQIFNSSTSAAVSDFYIDLETGATAGNPGYDALSSSGVPGGINPSNSNLISGSILYSFSRGGIPANQHSSVLYFSSDLAPAMGTGLIIGLNAGMVTVELPTPVPEPATIILLILASPILLKTRRRR